MNTVFLRADVARNLCDYLIINSSRFASVIFQRKIAGANVFDSISKRMIGLLEI